MTAPMGIAVYFTIWWIVLFAVLPFGVRSAHENGPNGVPVGSDPGAPVAPHLLRKAIWTTGISAVLFAALDAYLIWAP